MGATLSEPITTFDTTKGKSQNLSWAMASMQGWRIDMEDDHIILPNFTEDLALFAIFDGHGGPEVAKVAAKLYPNFLKSNEFFKKKDYNRALISSFEKFDLFMMSEAGRKVFMTDNLKVNGELCAGSTAIVALIEKNFKKSGKSGETEIGVTAYKDADLRNKNWNQHCDKISEKVFDTKIKNDNKGKKWKIWIANAGDCRGLLVESENRVFALNEEHKPMDSRERSRIEKAGGLIIKMRIDENLNLSRALGDFHYKSNYSIPFDEQLIISKPDIYEIVVDTEKSSYLFMGCDGVFEVLSDLEIARQVFKEKKKVIQETEDGPSLVDEIKEVIQNEKKQEDDNDDNNEILENEEGESRSGESLESSAVKDSNNSVKDVINENKSETKVEISDNEDEELNEMLENIKKVLNRTLAKPGQVTYGMGFDNMSAICVKLSI